jgi:dTDP-D-glucose 4,6-dehydratase
LKFLGLNLDFSIEKAKRELGYCPRVSFEEGMAETVRWYRSEEERKAATPTDPAPVSSSSSSGS